MAVFAPSWSFFNYPYTKLHNPDGTLTHDNTMTKCLILVDTSKRVKVYVVGFDDCRYNINLISVDLCTFSEAVWKVTLHSESRPSGILNSTLFLKSYHI